MIDGVKYRTREVSGGCEWGDGGGEWEAENRGEVSYVLAQLNKHRLEVLTCA